MKIIVPMAGRGSRLRPHTLTVPKPLIPIAGKPIVERLVKDIAAVLSQPVEEVAFIIAKDFGEAIEQKLKAIAAAMNAKGTIYYQDQPLGTGHAIMCAEASLNGPCVIAYADTLFRADFQLEESADSVIWVKAVDDPSQYGVVQLNEQQQITGLVEKPTKPVSNLAVIGIYYFKKAEELKAELQQVLEARLTHGGEYQINDGIKAMMAKGKIFVPGAIDEWMDCGSKNVTVATNSRMLMLLQDKEQLINEDVVLENTNIIPPCYIGKGSRIVNASIGPGVSIGEGCTIIDSSIKNTLIQNHSTIKNANFQNSMLGNHVFFDGKFSAISIGDYSVLD
ncbi:MAG: sugar phosphate nucleotidyltransferase [Flavobacteriaceae bacterium]|nr:sugar phosphate nucleotidyltransferase [Flavobacteriaceae bacterium]